MGGVDGGGDGGVVGVVREEGDDSVRALAGAAGVGRYTRHVLIWGGPSCCGAREAAESWGYLRKRVRELECEGRVGLREVFHNQVSCFGVCRDGPILIVYPDGVWYRAASPVVCERVLSEHVLGGQIVEEYVFAHRRLPGGLEP